MDQARRSRLLQSGLYIWRCLWPKPWPVRLDQVQGHGSFAQKDGREPAEIPVCFHRHVPTGVPPTTEGGRSEVQFALFSNKYTHNTIPLFLKALRRATHSFLHLLLLLPPCFRLGRWPVSDHPAHHRGASISYSVPSRAAPPGQGTSPSSFVTVWAPVTVPDQFWPACLVESRYPWPRPANRCSQAWRQSHGLSHSERPWAQLHGCPTQLQPNQNCTAAVAHIHPTPTLSARQLRADGLPGASTGPERCRGRWGCA